MLVMLFILTLSDILGLSTYFQAHGIFLVIQVGY